MFHLSNTYAYFNELLFLISRMKHQIIRMQQCRSHPRESSAHLRGGRGHPREGIAHPKSGRHHSKNSRAHERTGGKAELMSSL